jgi:hypothetical protein
MHALSPRLSCLALLVCLMLLASSAADGGDRLDGTRAVETRSAPTAEQARPALVAMVRRMPASDHDYFRLADLRAGKGMVILDHQPERWYAGCQWNCHLADRTFTFPGPLRPHGCTREDCGVFERVSGRWQARISGGSIACSK